MSIVEILGGAYQASPFFSGECVLGSFRYAPGGFGVWYGGAANDDGQGRFYSPAELATLQGLLPDRWRFLTADEWDWLNANVGGPALFDPTSYPYASDATNTSGFSATPNGMLVGADEYWEEPAEWNLSGHSFFTALSAPDSGAINDVAIGTMLVADFGGTSHGVWMEDARIAWSRWNSTARAPVRLVRDLQIPPQVLPPEAISRHAPMLRVLKGGSLGPADEMRIAIDAKYLDDVMSELQDILKEAFPDTAIDLSKWASVYGIASGASRDAILGYYSESNTAINAGSLVDIAAQMGYVIEVIGGDVMPFRADISKCDIDIVRAVNGGIAGHSYPFGGLYPDPPGWIDSHLGYVYSPDFWIITIRVLDIGSHQDDSLLRSAFKQIKRADTTLNWIEAWNG